MEENRYDIIAHIETPFPTKFGIPRQSGLTPEVEGRIVFMPSYRIPEMVRGLEGFSHIWLIWQFSENKGRPWSPTVRPPRLGGNTRMGVWATRSPFRPNALGLSAVRLLRMEKTPGEGTVLIVGGADLMDGTPIVDIKPYLPITDCIPDARGGFSDEKKDYALKVEWDPAIRVQVPEEKRQALQSLLSQDPRPSYQHEESRVYGFSFSGYEVSFVVKDDRLLVTDLRPEENGK